MLDLLKAHVKRRPVKYSRVLMCIFMTGFVFTLHNLTDQRTMLVRRPCHKVDLDLINTHKRKKKKIKWSLTSAKVLNYY